MTKPRPNKYKAPNQPTKKTPPKTPKQTKPKNPPKNPTPQKPLRMKARWILKKELIKDRQGEKNVFMVFHMESQRAGKYLNQASNF